MSFQIINAHVLDGLAKLPDNSVNCVITSPPYWSLRWYGTEPQFWGGDPNCAHAGTAPQSFCAKCRAWFGELGTEPTAELFVEHTVEVFRHIRRVLHPSGTVWLNIGDSFCSDAGADRKPTTLAGPRVPSGWTNRPNAELKPKDLVMMPAMLAMAPRRDGWYIRQQIPWVKRTAMPESTEDRPTSAVEYIFLLSKSADYFYDREAVRMSASLGDRNGGRIQATQLSDGRDVRVRKSGNKQRRLADGAKGDRVNDHLGSSIPWEGSTRARRNSDWFFASLETIQDGFQGLLVDEGLDPLAMLVNAQPFTLAMCEACDKIYPLKEYRALAQDEKDRRICLCGKVAWSSHFATFPQRLVEPCLLAGTSEYGCCDHCGAPYERIVEESAPVGDPYRPELGAENTTAKWSKGNAGNARNGDNPHTFSQVPGAHHRTGPPAPATIGWRPTCSHSLFPAGVTSCTVLDPFSGSGRTGLAAVKHGRNYIGIELRRQYAAMSEWQYRMAQEATA